MKRFLLFIISMIFISNLNAQVYDSGDKVGIGTSQPLEKLQIGDRWTFHNGGHKIIGYNTFYSGGHKRFFEDEVSILRFDSHGNIRFQSAPSGSTGVTFSVIDNMIIKNNGNIGIGTSNPQALLDVYGEIKLKGGNQNFSITDIDESDPVFGSFIHHGGIAINGNDGGSRQMYMFTDGSNSNNIFTIATSLDDGDNWESRFVVQQNGNIGIGTNDPKSKLTVNGTIISTEIKVLADISQYPDFVFSENYKLKSLQEVEKYIEHNKHLPDIPKAEEVTEGIALGEMNTKLLQKIEELTLYVIDLQKQVNDLKSQINEQQ